MSGPPPRRTVDDDDAKLLGRDETSVCVIDVKRFLRRRAASATTTDSLTPPSASASSNVASMYGCNLHISAHPLSFPSSNASGSVPTVSSPGVSSRPRRADLPERYAATPDLTRASPTIPSTTAVHSHSHSSIVRCAPHGTRVSSTGAGTSSVQCRRAKSSDGVRRCPTVSASGGAPTDPRNASSARSARARRSVARAAAFSTPREGVRRVVAARRRRRRGFFRPRRKTRRAWATARRRGRGATRRRARSTAHRRRRRRVLGRTRRGRGPRGVLLAISSRVTRARRGIRG